MCASIPTAIIPCEFDARPNAVSASVKITPPWQAPLKLRCAVADGERRHRAARSGIGAADSERVRERVARCEPHRALGRLCLVVHRRGLPSLLRVAGRQASRPPAIPAGRAEPRLRDRHRPAPPRSRRNREAGERRDGRAFGDEPVLGRVGIGVAERHRADHALVRRQRKLARDDAMEFQERHLRTGVEAARARRDHHVLQEHPVVEPAALAPARGRS